MLKIKQIHIKNFRSIVNKVINVEQMNIFVGLNDAGKSNILKALNLFFNGKTEPNKEFDFDTDYSKFAPIRKNKAKEIIISIVIEIPKHYKDNQDVIWTKKWRSSGLHYDSSADWCFSAYSKVPTLLKRIKYQYVPAVKSDNYFKMLLSNLYLSITNEANGELNNKAIEYSEALKLFTHRIGELVQKNIGIESGLTMPTNQVDIFKELIFMTRDTSGKNINLSYRGDGIKSMHIPAILKYIAEQDNKNLGSNAITYTQIWGYEEPENGVELRKCFDLAEEFMGFSTQIQQFITTHSPGFYGLGKRDNVKVFYVYKSSKDYSSVIQENVNVMDIHDKIGILPIVAPIIEEKEYELQQMRRNIENSQFTDVDTIFVEGITDKKYLEKAIQFLSKDLQQKIDEGTLKIVTREENGCGTSLLCDWAVAWMHFNYKSRAVVLLDCDEAGNTAKNKINTAKKEFQKKGFKLNVIQIQPTEDMKIVQAKIQKSLIFEIEHLLSYGFWEKIQEKHWVELKEVNELVSVYGHLMTRDKSLDTIIEEVVENEALKQTIIYWNPKDSKKDKIYEYAEQCCMESDEIFTGFSNTIQKLEKNFL